MDSDFEVRGDLDDLVYQVHRLVEGVVEPWTKVWKGKRPEVSFDVEKSSTLFTLHHRVGLLFTQRGF